MNGRIYLYPLATLLLALNLPASVSVAAAAAGQRSDQELDEVLVEGRRGRQRSPQQSFEWLARLVGQFTIDGFVDPRGDGTLDDLVSVQGQATCVGFGIAPGVQCELRVRWPEVKGPNGEVLPGGASKLDPAVMLFGMHLGPEIDERNYTIAHIMVDNEGVAESGAGYRIGADTVTYRSPCAEVPVDCEREVKIVAHADLETIDVRIEWRTEGSDGVLYDFVMHRVPDSKAVVFGRKPVEEKKK